VPYANGETTVVGDYVRNEFGQPGTVTTVPLENLEMFERMGVISPS
jgi:hypothetical protein